jgi:hypothetical protein
LVVTLHVLLLAIKSVASLAAEVNLKDEIKKDIGRIVKVIADYAVTENHDKQDYVTKLVTQSIPVLIQAMWVFPEMEKEVM